MAELKSKGCSYFVEGTEKPSNISEEMRKLDEAVVQNMILQRLDKKHHRLIMNKNTPRAILKTLDEYMEPASTFGSSSLWRTLRGMSFDAGTERATEFICRFENIVSRLKRLNETLDDVTEKREFLLAVEKEFPEVRRSDDAAKAAGREGLPLEALKSKLVEEDSRKIEANSRISNAAASEGNSAMAVGPMKHSTDGNNIVCYNCGRRGHYKDDCTRPEGEKYCYNCLNYSNTHISATCPYERASGSIYRGSNRRPWRGGRIGRGRSFGLRSSFRGRGGSEIQVRRGGPQPQFRGNNGTGRISKRKIFKRMRGKPIGTANAAVDATDEYYYVEMDEMSDSEQDSGNCFFAQNEGNAIINSNINRADFVSDSGASEHLMMSKNLLIDVKRFNNPKRITCAKDEDEADLLIEYSGTLPIVCDGGKIGKLKNVLYSPKLAQNLFSLRKLANKGIKIELDGKEIRLFDKNEKLIKTGKFDGKFWWLSFEIPKIVK